jgi:hypothetical protein
MYCVIDLEETIVEEKNKNGSILNKYMKGRYLGKVNFIIM